MVPAPPGWFIEALARAVRALRTPTTSVALVFEDDVFDDAAIGLDRGDDLIAFGLDHPRIVGPLKDDQGLGDLVTVKER